jgi:hypothetical protein
MTRFIYMISELTSISGVINYLTGLNGLPATIVEVAVTLAVSGLIQRPGQLSDVLHSIQPSVASGRVSSLTKCKVL